MNISTGQVSRHVHSIKIPFKIPAGKDRFIERFVYTHIIFEDDIVLIDSGVSGSGKIIFDYILKQGRTPLQISMIVLTHAHIDHIGGAPFIKDSTGCTVAAHPDDIRWMEDTELQEKERPVPGFKSLIEGNIKIDRILDDEEIIRLSNGSSLEVIHTPGHAPGHISLYYKKDRIMITGDCVPVKGDMPVYDDAEMSLASIDRLAKRKDIDVLLSAWDDPASGTAAYEKLKDGAGYIREIHNEVNRLKEGSADLITIAQALCDSLKLPPGTMNPLFFNTIAAHLKAADIL
jgi:glyoxylase-like metal-dependent hydrolase (beta-lactamase superfamily II)